MLLICVICGLCPELSGLPSYRDFTSLSTSVVSGHGTAAGAVIGASIVAGVRFIAVYLFKLVLVLLLECVLLLFTYCSRAGVIASEGFIAFDGAGAGVCFITFFYCASGGVPSVSGVLCLTQGNLCPVAMPHWK